MLSSKLFYIVVCNLQRAFTCVSEVSHRPYKMDEASSILFIEGRKTGGLNPFQVTKPDIKAFSLMSSHHSWFSYSVRASYFMLSKLQLNF